MITRDALACQLRDYLQHRITRAALVDWAEHAMMEEEFDECDPLSDRASQSPTDRDIHHPT
jgi:hypothetical protein